MIDEIYLYYDHPQLQCDYRENVAGCIGVPESTTTSLVLYDKLLDICIKTYIVFINL